jgi:hypothetical protein
MWIPLELFFFIFYLFTFFGGVVLGFELRASTLAQQVLYHLSHSASPVGVIKEKKIKTFPLFS